MAKTEPIIELKQAPDGTYIPDKAEHKHAPHTRPPKAKQAKEPKEPKEPDRRGRIDLLCSAAVEQTVRRTNDPLLTTFYEAMRPWVDKVFRRAR